MKCKKNLVNSIIPTTGLMAVMAFSISAYAKQDPAQADKADYEPPRNSQGQPDLQGVWDFRTLTPLERPAALGDKAVFTAEEQAAVQAQAVAATDVDKLREETAGTDAAKDIEGAYNNFWFDYGTTMNEDRRTSLITDPANGRLPKLTDEAVARLKASHATFQEHYPVRDILSIGRPNFLPEGPEALGLSERCLIGFNAGPPLTPSAYNNNLRIIQTPKQVVIFTEMIHHARIVPVDGSSHLPAEMTKWMGDSRGHWDGNTLVVETTNFTGKSPTFQLPLSLTGDQSLNGVVGTGENFTLTERFTRISDSRLIYEYTIDDPSTFTAPFTVAIPLKATEDQMYEYACHEGNHGAVGVLGGARQTEKEAGGRQTLVK